MKIAAHITFYYSEERIKYLNTVVDNLLALPTKTDIYIYTNEHFTLPSASDNVHHIFINYKASRWAKFSYRSLASKLGLKRLVNPFYLTWESRKAIQEKVDQYDAQLYLEDDMAFSSKNLKYWLKHKDLLLKNEYNLGFIRTEVDQENRLKVTDLFEKPTEIIEIEGQKFLVNDSNPYCGFWIYDKRELKAFIRSKEWKFKFRKYQIREKAAIGWHGSNMSHYKATLIPLIETDKSLFTDPDSSIHHLPNNYIGHEVFCKLDFPIHY